jgi:hypothetical protein
LPILEATLTDDLGLNAPLTTRRHP